MDIIDFHALYYNILKRIRYLQFGVRAQLAFLEDLSLLVNDGIPPNRAIEMMAQLSRGKTREVALSISEKISEGQPLAEGMRDWFSLNIVEIIRVGEEGGALADTIKSAISTLTQRKGTLSALLGAMTYPLMVLLMACVVIVYLNKAVLVQFREIKPVAEWPEAGRQLLAIGNFLQGWWWLILIGIGLIAYLLSRIMKNYVGDFRTAMDAFPPFSLYRRFVASRFLETLGLLITNGVTFKNALKVMEYQATPYLGSHLILMEHLLGMGKGNIADVLNTGLVSESDLLRLRVMAEVKGFEHGLVRMGIYGAEQNTATMRLIGRILGGIFLVIGAYLIILIVRGVYLTGMSLGTTGTI